ncbi:MAG: hypothetical protein AAFW81_11620 [Pseudomonadota bacterium]
MSMTEIFLLGGTLALAGVSILFARSLGPPSRAAFAFGVLVLMNGIYVGFAIADFEAKDFIARGDIAVLVVECLIAQGFLLAGLAVLNSPKPSRLGWLILGHGLIDVGHLLTAGPVAPDWYALLCVVYDAIVGAALVWLLAPADRSEPSQSPAAVQRS